MVGVSFKNKSPLRCVNSQGHDPRSMALSKKQSNSCECGCGELVSPGRRFRHGHWARVRASRSLDERFWEKVDRRGPDECWEWQASRNEQGYGWFWVPSANRMVGAHRVAYEITHGPLPTKKKGVLGAAGGLVLHSCDNPPCVNPAHLRLGDQTENMADKSERGRHPNYNGGRNPNAKLTPEQVEEIRRRYTGRYGEQSELGREYGVYASTIRDIVVGRKWKQK